MEHEGSCRAASGGREVADAFSPKNTDSAVPLDDAAAEADRLNDGLREQHDSIDGSCAEDGIGLPTGGEAHERLRALTLDLQENGIDTEDIDPELEQLEGLVELRMVGEVRSGSPRLSPTIRRSSPTTMAPTSHERGSAFKLSFDPWSVRPLSTESHILLDKQHEQRFRSIERETNLRGTPGLAKAEQERVSVPLHEETDGCPHWTHLWRRTRNGEYVDWEEETWWLLEHAFNTQGEPDFIGSSQSLKELFTIPYTEKQVSLVLSRAGSSLFVAGTDHAPMLHMAPDSPTASTAHEIPTSDSSSAPNGVLHWVFHPNNTDSSSQEQESRSPIEPLQSTDKPIPGVAQADIDAKDLLENFYAHVNGDKQEESAIKPRFRRTLKWEFDSMKLLVGSNLRVFQDESGQALSATLVGMRQLLSKEDCMEHYLENRLAGVGNIMVVVHRDGIVKHSKCYQTKEIPMLCDIPNLAEKTCTLSRPAFDPHFLEQRASQLLRFLKERINPGSSYWLFKEGKSNVIHLCQLGPRTASTKAGRERWMYTMAMLCARVASQYAKARRNISPSQKQGNKAKPDSSGSFSSARKGNACPDLSELIVKERELLLKALELLQEILAGGGPPRLLLQAQLNEDVAETFLAEAEVARNVAAHWRAKQFHTGSQFSQLTATIKLALAHLQLTANYLWAYRRATQQFPSARGDSESSCSDGEPDCTPFRTGADDVSSSLNDSFGSEKSEDEESQEVSSPEASEALVEIQARLQSRVLYCFLYIADEQLGLGNLDSVFQTVQLGLLCKGTFDRWDPEWAKRHSRKDVATALLLMGDAIFETSKRAVHSSNCGPAAPRSVSPSWIEYTESTEKSLLSLLHMLNLPPDIFPPTYSLPEHFPPACDKGKDNENMIVAERMGLCGVFLYTLATKLARVAYGSQDNENYKRAHWKLGNAWNEVGKLRSRLNYYVEAKEAYLCAVDCFSTGGDAHNAALVLFNLNHMLRALAVSSGMAAEKPLMERLETQRGYLERGIEALERAGKLLQSRTAPKAVNNQVSLEKAMNHLTMGVALRGACCASGVPWVDVVVWSERAIVHLRAALRAYESCSKVSIAFEKAGAAHYHIGSHFAWAMGFNGGDHVLELTGTDSSAVSKLAKRHFAMASKSLTGAALAQCQAEMQALNVTK